MTDDYAAARERMVSEQIAARGVRDRRVLDVMRRVPRHIFIPDEHRHEAYEDHPVAIGFGQTISQPYIVAFMTEALDVGPAHRVLEVGTGCGYQTAVLAELASEVFSLDIVEQLAARAEQTLAALHYANVHVRTGDGYVGWPERAPFERILVAAAPEELPGTLVEQLADDGLMAIPIGRLAQQLRIIRRTGERLETITTLPVRFVPMVRPDLY